MRRKPILPEHLLQKKNQRKWTWISPDRTVKNAIDFILSNNRKICRDVTVLNRFDGGSDHRLVRAAFRINTKIERKKLFHKEKFPTTDEIEIRKQEYQHELKKKLEPIEEVVERDIDNLSNKIKSDIRTVTKKLCTSRKRKHKSIISPNTIS